MIVNHKKKYLFISTPKIGTNSLYTYLGKDGAVRFGGFHETRDIFPLNYFRFSTCRNPYDRALSGWYSTCMREEMRATDRYEFRRGCNSKGLNPESLDDWLRFISTYKHNHDHITSPQYRWHRQFHLDRVLPIESINKGIKTIPIGCYEPVSKENTTPEKKDQYLTQEAIELIDEIYREDFRIYGYKHI